MNNNEQDKIESIAKSCYEKFNTYFDTNKPLNVLWENLTEKGRQYWLDIVVLVKKELEK